MADAWTKTSWRNRPALQMPVYRDKEALAATEASDRPRRRAQAALSPPHKARVTQATHHGI